MVWEGEKTQENITYMYKGAKRSALSQQVTTRLKELGGGSVVVVDFLFIVTPMWGSVIVLCFFERYFMSILVLQSS